MMTVPQHTSLSSTPHLIQIEQCNNHVILGLPDATLSGSKMACSLIDTLTSSDSSSNKIAIECEKSGWVKSRGACEVADVNIDGLQVCALPFNHLAHKL